MTIRIPRCFAIFVLLCLLPRAGALTVTVTQTATFNLSGWTSGIINVPLIAEWNFAPFAVIDGRLDKVEISGVASIVAAVTEVNPLTVPLMNGSFVVFESYLSLGQAFGGTNLPVNVTSSGSQDVQPAMIPVAPIPWASQTINYTRTNTFSTILTSPDQLSFFRSGTEPLVQHNKYGGWTGWGTSSASGTSQITITYTYAALPEDGSAVFFFAASCALIYIVDRRRQIRQPRA